MYPHCVLVKTDPRPLRIQEQLMNTIRVYNTGKFDSVLSSQKGYLSLIAPDKQSNGRKRVVKVTNINYNKQQPLI